MYFDKATDTHAIKPEGDVAFLMSANGLGVLALGILPQPLMALCAYAIQQSL
jgi:NADH-quinone oxidoreductase subunit N